MSIGVFSCMYLITGFWKFNAPVYVPLITLKSPIIDVGVSDEKKDGVTIADSMRSKITKQTYHDGVAK